MEISGTLGVNSGWQPEIQTLRMNDRLDAVSTLYSKTNSNGEYIFDWAWADAFIQNGIPYYPKLISSTPFTPATSPKLLIREGTDKKEVAAKLLKAALETTREGNYSSLHYLFITQEELPYFEKQGFFIRDSFQFHWINQGYEAFDDFLGELKTKKRKQIVRERNHLKAAGLNFKVLKREDIRFEHAEIFYDLYLKTINKMRAIPYLNVEFFKSVFMSMSEKIILITAEEYGVTIAGALYFTGGEHLYGRYWGATKDVRNLHFELCYYLPIEWAITNNIKLFEAGAQGEHKFARGFRPCKTYSAHWIKHPEFSRAIKEYINQERQGIQTYFEELEKRTPFKNNS